MAFFECSHSFMIDNNECGIVLLNVVYCYFSALDCLLYLFIWALFCVGIMAVALFQLIINISFVFNKWLSIQSFSGLKKEDIIQCTLFRPNAMNGASDVIVNHAFSIHHRFVLCFALLFLFLFKSWGFPRLLCREKRRILNNNNGKSYAELFVRLLLFCR